jgi:prolyl oligopeptidase
MKPSLLFALMLAPATAVLAQTNFTPPPTPAKLVRDTLHGVVLTDNYRWLEDKTNADVIAWTRAQHDYGIKYLQSVQKVHPDLKERIAAYINLDYEGPLQTVGKRVFQTIKLKGDKQYKIYTYLAGKKLLIWDPVQLDTTGKTSNTNTSYTYDGEKLAVSVQKSGHEINTVYLIDTRTGKQIYAPLENIDGFDWTKDQQQPG